MSELVALVIWISQFQNVQGNRVTVGYIDGITSSQCVKLLDYDRWDGSVRVAYKPSTKRCVVVVKSTPEQREAINEQRI